MNPSAKGWIAKYGKLISEIEISVLDYDSIYYRLRRNGFIYGYYINIPEYLESSLNYSTDEIAKINLLDSLFRVYVCQQPSNSFKDFLDFLLLFYCDLESISKDEVVAGKSKDNKAQWIEKIIDERVKIGDNALTRNFNSILTNTLLYVDILTFKEYLSGRPNIKRYAINLENVIMNISVEVSALVTKSGYVELGEKYSSRHKQSYFFSDSKTSVLNQNYRKSLLTDYDTWGRLYFMDISCAICYSDLHFNDEDIRFTETLSIEMGLTKEIVLEARNSLISFFYKNKKAQNQLRDSNPLLNFYDHSYNLVAKLIKRNIKRILKEVTKSKELVYLLAEARKRPLNIEEQKMIQNQLFDILKSIPSLAIFLLPGGAILLPIFAKILPNLLPSSFDENRI